MNSPLSTHMPLTCCTLQSHKRNVFKLQNDILDAKQEYHATLRNLESISDSIHESRSNQMSLLEPRGQGVGAENPDGVRLIESSISDNLSIPYEVERELESTIKTLTLKDRESANAENVDIDEDQESLGEISLRLSDGDDSDKSSCLLDTPPPLRKTSVAMEGKLFVSPLTPEQSENNLENSSIQLEKWFFFSPAVEDDSSTTDKQLNDTGDDLT